MDQPTNTDALYDEAERLLEDAERHDETGDHKRALEASEKVIALGEQIVEAELGIANDTRDLLTSAHNLRGISLEALDRRDDASEAYLAALEIDPDFRIASSNLYKLSNEMPGAADGDFHLVTIATFSEPLEANILRGKLEAAGIPAFVADAETVQANWLFSLAIGGVKLRVRAEHVEQAREILDLEAETDSDTEAEIVICPNCGAEHPHYHQYAKRLVFASWFLLGFPLPIFKRRWHCDVCNHEWRE